MQRKISKLKVLERIPKSNARLRAKLQVKKAIYNRMPLAAAIKTNQATAKCEQKTKDSYPAYDKK